MIVLDTDFFSSFFKIKKVDLSICESFIDLKEMTGLGKGELGCMVLAKEHGVVILISDGHARQIAMDKKLKAMSIPTFLLRYKRERKISI